MPPRTPEALQAKIDEILADERYAKRYGGKSAGVANVVTNAPLALIQMGLESQVRALRWALGHRETL